MAGLYHRLGIGVAFGGGLIVVDILHGAQTLREGEQLIRRIYLLKGEAVDLAAIFIRIGELLGQRYDFLPGQPLRGVDAGIRQSLGIKQVFVIVQIHARTIQRQGHYLTVHRAACKGGGSDARGGVCGDIFAHTSKIILGGIVGNQGGIRHQYVDRGFSCAQADLNGVEDFRIRHGLYLDGDAICLCKLLEHRLQGFQIGDDKYIQSGVGSRNRVTAGGRGGSAGGALRGAGGQRRGQAKRQCQRQEFFQFHHTVLLVHFCCSWAQGILY